MKIINAAHPERKPPSREEFLEREIARLQIETGVYDGLKEKEWSHLSVADKESDYKTLQVIQRRNEEMEERVELTQHTSFPAFTLLPPELRIRIWGYLFDDHCHTRVHNISESGSKFMSNHPLSPLLHVCQESRLRYLRRTRNTFAFETYVNFERDTFYIINVEDQHDTFPRFLAYEFVHQIRTLAMSSCLFTDLPLPQEPMFHAYYTMRLSMTGWKETLIVFDDARRPLAIWGDLNMVFRDLSAREKRKHAERGYARYYAKLLNKAMLVEHATLEPMLYRYVVLEAQANGGGRVSEAGNE